MAVGIHPAGAFVRGVLVQGYWSRQRSVCAISQSTSAAISPVARMSGQLDVFVTDCKDGGPPQSHPKASPRLGERWLRHTTFSIGTRGLHMMPSKRRPGPLIVLTFLVCAGCSGADTSGPASTFSQRTTATAVLPVHSSTTRPGPTAAVDPIPATGRTTAPVDAGLPDAMIGTWRSLDQGSAEVRYNLMDDGSFTRASVLIQSRSSGTFVYTIGTAGTLEVTGSQLVLTPRRGTKSMQDPDSLNGSYKDRPLTDLTAETYRWSVAGDRLTLVGKYGLVDFERLPAGG